MISEGREWELRSVHNTSSLATTSFSLSSPSPYSLQSFPTDPVWVSHRPKFSKHYCNMTLYHSSILWESILPTQIPMGGSFCSPPAPTVLFFPQAAAPAQGLLLLGALRRPGYFLWHDIPWGARRLYSGGWSTSSPPSAMTLVSAGLFLSIFQNCLSHFLLYSIFPFS